MAGQDALTSHPGKCITNILHATSAACWNNGVPDLAYRKAGWFAGKAVSSNVCEYDPALLPGSYCRE